jgi:transcription attenuation protein (tryptophan RNA-binding attenuator protein)
MEYIVIKAQEDGLNVLSIDSNEGGPVVNERLDEGEVLILPLRESYLGLRIRGKAEVDTVHGKVYGASKILFT